MQLWLSVLSGRKSASSTPLRSGSRCFYGYLYPKAQNGPFLGFLKGIYKVLLWGLLCFYKGFYNALRLKMAQKPPRPKKP